MSLRVEILSRLPAKSIARCRCVSKLWASISQARPQLLLTCHKEEIGELFLFSSPQLQYSDANSSLVTTASYRMKIPFGAHYEPIWQINGLVFHRDHHISEGRKTRAKVSIIGTGQSLVLSELKSRRVKCLLRFLGYDPIEKQFKVFSTIRILTRKSQEFQVMALGTKETSWRKVECCIPPHCSACNMICINGVLYYGASGLRGSGPMIVCFDIRFEKINFEKVSNNITRPGSTLINYNGKLGSLVSDGPCFTGRSRNFVLWILEDTEKHEWSNHIHVLPPLWVDILGDISVDVVGMVGANEIVFSPHTHSLPFYVFYYNIEQNTIRRIEIQGLEGSKGNRVHTFLNYLEDIKPING